MEMDSVVVAERSHDIGVRKEPFALPKAVHVAFPLVVAGAALRYWIASIPALRTEPLSVVALYKTNDIEYLPMASALARLRVGEWNVLERAGHGLTSFPLFSVALHSMSMAVAGVYGLIAADVIVFLLFYAAIVHLLKVCRIRSPWRECVALVLAAGGATNLQFYLSPRALWLFFRDWKLDSWIWGSRFPRPFPSELFIIVSLALMLRLLWSRRALLNKASWLVMGVVLSAVLQGDMHTALVLLLSLGPIVAYAWWRAADRRRELLLCLGGFAIGFAGASTLFLLQRLAEHPDLPRRLGAFHVGRLEFPFQLSSPKRTLVPRLLWLLVCGWLVWRTADRTDRMFKLRVLGFFALAILAAFFTLPVSTFLAGQSIQLYHFPSRFRLISSYVFLVSGLWAVQAIAAWITPWARQRVRLPVALPHVAIASVLLWTVGWNVWGQPFFTGPRSMIEDDAVRGEERLTTQSHMRAGLLAAWRQLPNYRSDFSALAQELSSARYSDARVMATADLQLFCWWMTFTDGYTFLPETFLTTVPDAEIERRLMLFGRLLGMDDAAFLEFVNRKYVIFHWLAHDKYQASKAHTFAPIDDYDADARRAIADTNIFSSWSLRVPLSEQRRLLDAYRRTPLDMRSLPRLDMIVLINGLEDFTPVSPEFVRAYSNATFTVWKRASRDSRTASKDGL